MSDIHLTDKHLESACILLHIEKSRFAKWVCKRQISTGKETVVKNLSVEAAKSARESIAKYIYSKLFDWLVDMINKSLAKSSSTKTFIGLLDIYGFEIFQVNSFEQFCINYANEKLQQEFVQHVFKLEQQVQ